MAKYSLIAQRAVLAFHGLQFAYLSYGYLAGSQNNRFTLLENLFSADISRTCTQSGCWLSLTPFLGSLICFRLFLVRACPFSFDQGRELRLVLVNVATIHMSMAIARYAFAAPQFYPPDVLDQLSLTQLPAGAVTLALAALPYPSDGQDTSAGRSS